MGHIGRWSKWKSPQGIYSLKRGEYLLTATLNNYDHRILILFYSDDGVILKADGKRFVETVFSATPSISSRFGLIPANSVLKWLKIPEGGSTGEKSSISHDKAQLILNEFDDCGDGYLSVPKLMIWLEMEPTVNSFAEAELKKVLLQVCITLVGIATRIHVLSLSHSYSMIGFKMSCDFTTC